MAAQASLIRRYLECTAFVLLWMAAQFYFRISPLATQFLGIPSIAFFQLAVARRPLQRLWAFDATAFRLEARTLALAAALVLGCGSLLWLGRAHVSAGLGPRGPMLLLVAAAAIPAAFALRQQRAGELVRALPWALGAMIWRVGWRWAWTGEIGISGGKALDFFTLWAVEAVSLFLVDEVAFRGAIDPHLAGAAPGRLHAWCSAVFGAMLWSVWHLPSYFPGERSFGALFGRITPWYLSVVLMGTLLAFCARRARTLVPTAVTHAFGNAYLLALLK